MTFYSFKGGTGRTMALANIAILLALAGKKVLAVDFDLEAPGLWRFFQDFQPDLDRRAGLVDLLMAQSQPSPDASANWRNYVIPVNFSGGSISLITSGRMDAGYASRVLEFTWNELYRQSDGGVFIEKLRTEWAGAYDFTLIDSRTGITDTGGVCTIALPDLIVPVFTANRQSVEGTLDVLKLAQKGRQEFAYDRPPALVLPILSRFDMRTEYETANEWLDLMSDELGVYYADWVPAGIPARRVLERTKLPYVAYFSFGEKLAVLREGTSDPESLGYALNSVSRLIESQLRDVAAVAGDVASFGPEVIEPRITVPAIMGGVPPQNPHFTGREEMLQTIKNSLRHGGHGAILPQVLHGLGGVGKTQIAAEYAHRFQSDYELIWWVPSDDDNSIQRSLVSLARRIGIPESADAAVAVEMALDQLRVGNPSSRWLLVYDGAPEPGKLRRYLPSGPGHVLITSRSQSWVSQPAAVEVDVFTPEESAGFLAQRWSGITAEDARVLAEELGYLPLALEQAVAVHLETGMPLADYLDLFRASPGQLLAEGGTADYPVSLAKTVRLAFESLMQTSPAAAQLLELCSFLSSRPIAVPMLARGRGAGLPAELAQTLRDDIKLRLAVREIGRYALAQFDSSRDSIRIHVLVRALIRDGLAAGERREAEHGAHELLALANPGSPDNETTWPQHAQIAPHVGPSGIIHSGDPHVRRVVLDQIRYFYVIGDYSVSARLARLAVDVWQNRLGPADEMTMLAKLHLGNALRALGDYVSAREINRGTLQQMRDILGADHVHALSIANSYGADLRLLGDFRQAKDIDQDTFERYRRVLQFDDPATLRSANNLAVDHRLLGSFDDAQSINTETLRLRTALLGDDHPEVLSSATAVVRDLYDHGEYGMALSRAREILGKFEPLLPDHTFVLLARRILAILERKTGRYADAAVLSERNLEETIGLFGSRHEHSLAAMMTLCNALRERGKLKRACSVGEAALHSYREQFGAEHLFTVACACNLAIAYRALGRIDQADFLDTSASQVLARALQAHHLYSLCSACSVSNNLSGQGRNAEAAQASDEAYQRAEQVLAPDHPVTLALAANLALDLEATGATKKAAALRRDTVERLRRKLGLEHPVTTNVERGRRSECDIEVPPT